MNRIYVIILLAIAAWALVIAIGWLIVNWLFA